MSHGLFISTFLEKLMRHHSMATLWALFKQEKNQKAREEIVSRYEYLVKVTAGLLVSPASSKCERDDLVSVGNMGLVKAVDNFNPERGVKFETFAISLIRGSILEMLRNQDWVPRLLRQQQRQIAQASESLERQYGRIPSEAEIAREMGIPEPKLEKIRYDTQRAQVTSLDNVLCQSENSTISFSDMMVDETANVYEDVVKSSQKIVLSKQMKRLPDREQRVMKFYYLDNMTFKEIGRILEISESRVYQLHTQAISRMRNYLQRETPLFA